MTPGLAVYSATRQRSSCLPRGCLERLATAQSRSITFSQVQSTPILNPASGDWATPQIGFTALKRYGTVDEVAALVAFVASPEAAYITVAESDSGRWYQRLRHRKYCLAANLGSVIPRAGQPFQLRAFGMIGAQYKSTQRTSSGGLRSGIVRARVCRNS